MRKLILAVMLALATVALGGPALAHDVPNEAGWHTHDGVTGSPHHKPVVFFPALFTAAGLGTYGSAASGGYLDCPNATDKGLLPGFGQSQSGVHAVGICMNDLYIIHLHSGVAAPAGWDFVDFGGNRYWYRVTARG